MTQTEIRRFTSWLGKRSYRARLERLGLERVQQIARENGRKGGRPRSSSRKHRKDKQQEGQQDGV